MATIRPFCGIRPLPQFAQQVASFPYDVLSSQEARQLAANNPLSFLHVEKAEIDLPPETYLYDPQVYQQARTNWNKFQSEGIFVQDPLPSFYLYEQQMRSHRQVGLVATVAVDEYNRGIIKKHEHTRPDKEADRTQHILTIEAQTGPVFLAYQGQYLIDQIVEQHMQTHLPLYDFVKEDGIAHRFWPVFDPSTQERLMAAFAQIDYLYIADGHHRSAAAARAARERPANSYQYFLAVIFPAQQLKIFDYNRVVADLQGLTPGQFLEKIQLKFEIQDHPSPDQGPLARHQFGMYLARKWYLLTARPHTFLADHPVAGLDVSILQENLLSPILKIQDPRTDQRIDFIGGIRGISAIEQRVDQGLAQVGFSLFPTSMEELMAVASIGQVMPPKSTWFEPKLRSGLVIHSLQH